MRKPLGEIYDFCRSNADFCVNLARTICRKFKSRLISKAISPGEICGRNFIARILRRRLLGLLTLFWRALDGLWTAKFYRKDFSEQNLCSLRLPAPHKILRRSCRDFAPILRRFLQYRAQKFFRRILTEILPCGILPYEISPR